jgi:excisionase family DNA binding protein
MNNPATESLLTYDEVATRLKLTRRGIEGLVQRRAIPLVKLSARCHRFRWNEIEAALTRLTVKPI